MPISAKNGTLSTGRDASFNLFDCRLVVLTKNFGPSFQMNNLQVGAIDRNRPGRFDFLGIAGVSPAGCGV
jgi:hypothetical protein